MKQPLLMACLVCLFMSLTLAYGQSDDLSKVKSYLDQKKAELRLNNQDFAELVVTNSYTEKNAPLKRIYVQQKLNGIDIEGGTFSLHENITTKKAVGTNNLVILHELQKEGASPNRTADNAVRKALEHLNIDASTIQLKETYPGAEKKTIFKRNDTKIWDIPVRLVYLVDEKSKALKLVWEVQVYELNQKHYWVTYVEDKTGKVVRKIDLVVECNFNTNTDQNVAHHQHQHGLTVNAVTDDYAPEIRGNNSTNGANNEYRVYDLPIEAPNDPIAAHTLVVNPGDPVASPDGWHKVGNSVTYNYTRGNNAYAFHDPSPGPLGGAPNPATAAINNGGPGGIPTATEPFRFNYPVDLTQQPETYRSAAIVNLFYWNNLIHDVFYQFGFNEDAGNFQSSHVFSDGQHGSTAALDGQNDEVWAQAQDGGGTNNANFLTLPDGTNGQMQMYLWTASMPDSIVQITSSTSGVPPSGTKYIAIPGAFASPTAQNLYTNPVLNREFVIVQKNALSTVGSDSEGCTSGQQSIALPPRNNVQNKIVLIDRGSCSFVEKVYGAQQGGAAGVIVINNVDGPPITMGGSDAPGFLITIPAVMISKADGEILKSQLRSGATIIGSLKLDNPPAPKRDGDFDNGVIAHEYGHGISNRLTGGRKALGPLGGQEQGGEGWSDFIGLYMITTSQDLLPATPQHPNGILPNKGIGTYVVYQGTNGNGIRPARYSIDKNVNNYHFIDIGKGGEVTVPHGVGFIWCTMLYEMEQALIDQYGFNNNIYQSANPDANGAPMSGSGGNNIAMRLVIEGMKLQRTAPTFIQQRDAILKADTLLYGARHSCTIWKAFAKRGLGFGASSGSNALGDEQQGFDLPPACAPNQKRMNVRITGPARVMNNSTADYTISVKNIHTADVSNVIIKEAIPDGTSLLMASDGGTQVGNNIVWNLANVAAGQTKNLTMTLSVNKPSGTIFHFSDNHETTTGNWTTDARPDTWKLVSRDAYSGSKTWYAQEVEDPTHNVWLQLVPQVTVPASGGKLSFYHMYQTEKNYDAGLVEISANGGPWTYLPPNKFEQNGYNSVIPPANNPNIGTAATAAFSGATLGYINSVADLSDYAGQQIRVRFRYTCDVASLASAANPGWYIDDVYFISNLTTIKPVTTLELATTGETVYDSTGNAPSASLVTIVQDNAPLPASMTPLNAVAQTNHIRLNWKTLTELRTDGFEIERKAENEPDFQTVGFVKASGNSTVEKAYMFNDGAVRPNVYYHYRLKQKDLDGNQHYSNIAVAKLGIVDNGVVFDIMPNPANSVANLVISTPGRTNGIIRIYDAMGKPFTTLNAASANNSVQRYEVNVANLPAGTYWVELVVDDIKMTKRLVISR